MTSARRRSTSLLMGRSGNDRIKCRYFADTLAIVLSPRLLLPFVGFVFLVRQHMSHVHSSWVVNHYDQAVLVARNVKNGEFLDLVCTSKEQSNFSKALPVRRFHRSDPMPQR